MRKQLIGSPYLRFRYRERPAWVTPKTTSLTVYWIWPE